MKGKLFRQANEFPASSSDFLSHAEKKKKNCDAGNCLHWGCSVWLTVEAAQHARGLFPHFRRTYIVVGEVAHEDGVVKATPNSKQPGHHTFWKAFDRDIANLFEVAIAPDLTEGET